MFLKTHLPWSSTDKSVDFFLTAIWLPHSQFQGDSLTNPMLITVFVQVWLKGHQEPRNEVGSLSPAECLVGFEPGTFRFWLQCPNPLGHSPRSTK